MLEEPTQNQSPGTITYGPDGWTPITPDNDPNWVDVSTTLVNPTQGVHVTRELPCQFFTCFLMFSLGRRTRNSVRRALTAPLGGDVFGGS